jgi:hypothetical protein
MFYLFTNLLAVRDDDPWIQLIIVAVIIVFGIVKTIFRSIKATIEQKPDESKDSSTPSKPKKRYVAADGSYKTLEQLREEKIAQIRAAFGIPQPPAEPSVEPPPIVVERPQVVETIGKPIPVIHRPGTKKPSAYFEPQPQKVYAEPAPSKISDEEHKAPTPSMLPADKTVYELLFSSRQDLRNAILYQEILGKPLALRDSL